MPCASYLFNRYLKLSEDFVSKNLNNGPSAPDGKWKDLEVAIDMIKRETSKLGKNSKYRILEF